MNAVVARMVEMVKRVASHADPVPAWLPDTEGQGTAEVLLGSGKPSGEPPQTWPASMAQAPCNAGEPIRDKPLFPYGAGLTR